MSKLDFFIKSTYTLSVFLLAPKILQQLNILFEIYAVYSIIVANFLAWLSGIVFAKYFKLVPSLLVQLILGLGLKYFYLEQAESVLIDLNLANQTITNQENFTRSFSDLSNNLRNLAMAVLVMRAGLGFDLDALKKVATTCISLTILPCLTEILTCGFLASLILSWENQSWIQNFLWGASMGCVLGAVTPAVIVPAVEFLKSQNLVKSETQKSIVNLIVAASSFDDVLAISLFTVILGLLIGETSASTGALAVVWQFIKGPTHVILGIGLGWVLAKILYQSTSNSKTFTIFLNLTFPVIFYNATLMLGIDSAGPIGCIIFGLYLVQNDAKNFKLSAKILDTLWLILEPAMFILIGCELNFSNLTLGHFFRLLLLLLISLLLRTIAAYMIALKIGNFNQKESLFISLAWLPKATVQAAIGAYALQNLVRNGVSNSNLISIGEDILAIAVLSILITAPLGAFLIKFTAQRLLHHDSEEAEHLQA